LRSDAFPAVITGMFAQMTGQLPPDEQQRVGARVTEFDPAV